MIEKAIEKIKDEMSKNNNLYTRVIGNCVLSKIEINPSAIEKIADGSKTLKGSLKEIENEARKRAVGGVGILTDEEGLAIVAKYFGFEAIQSSVENIMISSNTEPKKIEEEKPNKPQVEFNVSLDDFLK